MLIRFQAAPARRYALLLAFVVLGPAGEANASTLDGDWTFEKSVSLAPHDGNAAPARPAVGRLHAKANRMTLSASCMVAADPMPYSFDLPFQPQLKAGMREAAVASRLKTIGFDLSAGKQYFIADDGPDRCNQWAVSILVSGDTLLAINGENVYAYHRAAASASQPDQAGSTRAAVAPEPPGAAVGTSVPRAFSLTDYISTCLANYPMSKGVPQATTRCAPRYAPQVATRGATDAVAKLVGQHHYRQHGADNPSGDYDAPVAHGLHPVYVRVATRDDVAILRVDDLETQGEKRDPIRGVYLSIRHGEVVDQLNEGCDFDASYVCSSPGEPEKFRLEADGHFKRIP